MSAAAFTLLSPEEQEKRLTALARTCVSRYELTRSTEVKMLNLSENATFLVEDAQAGIRSILRIHRPWYHTENAIRAELKWISALRGHPEIYTAEPIRGIDGDFVQVLDHAAVPEPRYAVMFSFLQGREPDPCDTASFQQLGAVTAHLHKQTEAWPDAAQLERHTWDLDSMFFGPNPLWGRWQDGVGVRGRRAQVLEKLAMHIHDRLTTYGKERHRFGLIHADLRLANLLVHEGRVQVIDFDDCGYSWYMYDLASALSFIEDHPRVPALIDAWLCGYRSVRKLSEADVELIPTFIMARRLLLVAWVGSHQEAPYPRQLGEGFTEGTVRLAERYFAEQGI
jgi:Ser/Thr protein kinase RdoA (MazF antagonist)